MNSNTLAPRAAASWRAEHNPGQVVAALIGATLLLRLLLAATTGLGIDESYMVALSRDLQFGYFDHPPVAWWLTWAVTHLAGNEAPLTVRLPFILLFAASTWLMYRLTADLYGERTGVWAALAFNIAPQFGVTSASWVLPDGPLIFSLLAAVFALQRALFGSPSTAARWWIAAGLAAGVALLSKYSAVLTIAGAGLFLLTSPPHRVWLRRPQPYLAAALALGLFAIVVVWNIDHQWASFAFQGGRATGSAFRPWQPFAVLAGEAVFLLPWVWAVLIAGLVAAARAGRRRSRGWLLSCLAIGPLLLFALVSAWSEKRILFHWAAPGYLMLFPLAGHWLSEAGPKAARWIRIGTAASAGFVLLGVLLVGSEVRLNWLPETVGDIGGRHDPDMDAVDWISVRSDLERRGFMARDDVFVAATRWMVAGKLDYALGGSLPVACLCADSREYGIVRPQTAQVGRDALIITPQLSLAEAQSAYGNRFDAIEELPPIPVMHGGKPALALRLFLGHRLRAVPAIPASG